MQDYIKRGGYPNGFTFADGVPAPFAQSIAISHPLTDTNKEQLKLLLLAEKSEVASRNAVRRKKEGAAAPYFGDLPSPPFDRMVTMGWQFKETVAVRQFVGDSLLVKSEKLSNASRLANAPARPRPIFDVPKEPGLCLPYIFVPDDGKARRGLSMSYRLKDHPDIQITLTDSSAYRPQDSYQNMGEAEIKHRNKGAEPDPEIADFWGQWLTMARKYESQWLVPDTTRPVTMAGYEGRQSFVLLTLDDGTKSYGYYAVVRGKPDATEDTPDLRLYVQQDMKQAQGKTPLTKEQFIEMAQAIAKSVQRRPVAPN